MRQIGCHICGDSAHWVIFDSIAICDRCRQVPVGWFREHLTLESHPFLNEFDTVTRPRARVRVVK